MSDLWKESCLYVSAALTVWFIILQQEVNKDTFEHCLRICIQIRTKKIKGGHFFWNLREHVVFAEGSLTRTIVFRSFIQAASLMRHTIIPAWWNGHPQPASAFMLLWRKTVSCKTFPRLEQCPVPLISKRCVFYMSIHRNIDTTYLLLKCVCIRFTACDSVHLNTPLFLDDFHYVLIRIN